MNYMRFFTPALCLRAGLSFVLLYAGIAALAHPEEWIGFIPTVLSDHVSADLLLKAHALTNLVAAALLLCGAWMRYVALIVALELASVVIMNPHSLIITFRDIGLVFAALALVATTFPQPKK